MVRSPDSPQSPSPRGRSAQAIRRRYVNPDYPLVVLRFEDGHEIRIAKGQGKTFNAYVGETVKIVAVWDATADERVVISVLKAEQFEEGE